MTTAAGRRWRRFYGWVESEAEAAMLGDKAERQGWDEVVIRKASETCYQVFAVPPRRVRLRIR